MVALSAAEGNGGHVLWNATRRLIADGVFFSESPVVTGDSAIVLAPGCRSRAPVGSFV
jgi:hypothetical protein